LEETLKQLEMMAAIKKDFAHVSLVALVVA
jgi:hypothetical protein